MHIGQSDSVPDGGSGYACKIIPSTSWIEPGTTWTGWLELGAKIEIKLGDYWFDPNTPSSFAKFCYNDGFQGTNGEIFRVQISQINTVNWNSTAEQVDYSPAGPAQQ